MNELAQSSPRDSRLLISKPACVKGAGRRLMCVSGRKVCHLWRAEEGRIVGVNDEVEVRHELDLVPGAEALLPGRGRAVLVQAIQNLERYVQPGGRVPVRIVDKLCPSAHCRQTRQQCRGWDQLDGTGIGCGDAAAVLYGAAGAGHDGALG